MVGGPYCAEAGTPWYGCDTYADRREDVVRNEVALDYNAGLVATLAALAMGADVQPPSPLPSPAAPPAAPPSSPQPPSAPPQPTDGCCLWPRPPHPDVSCENCTSFALEGNWLDASEES